MREGNWQLAREHFERAESASERILLLTSPPPASRLEKRLDRVLELLAGRIEVLKISKEIDYQSLLPRPHLTVPPTPPMSNRGAAAHALRGEYVQAAGLRQEADDYMISADRKKMFYQKGQTFGITSTGKKPEPGKGILNTSAVSVKS